MNAGTGLIASLIGSGVMTIIFVALFVFMTWMDPRPQIEGHWGGLGGGLGGWRIAPSILFLIAALGMGSITASLANNLAARPADRTGLSEKYQPVIRLMAELRVRNIQWWEQSGKLRLQGEAADAIVKNRIWDQIKLVNPLFDDVTANITVAAGAK